MAAPAAALTRVAVYRRRVAASAARVWENVRDWEHLPWLHRMSFRSIVLEDEGDWGWRARVGLPPAPGGLEILLELRLAADSSRYVARTLAGPGAGSEIWTRVDPLEERATGIEVEFWLPGVAPERADALGAAYTALYQRLWDEDEGMITRRAQALSCAGGAAQRAESPPALSLGALDALRARLPVCVELQGVRWRLVELHGAVVAHAAGCPHWGGPLEDAPVAADGTITCPWHGWRFDLRTGRSADGRRARLPAPPRIERDAAGCVHLRAAATGSR
ncbi:MAG TPA: Rieske 2Fe-2S domain-containing protein [Myxococcota bacterium]|nr:Rieske 2Fe-2S domain-containing protein [Myxococcota bacterium]